MRFWFMLAAALILAGCSSHQAPPPNPRLADSITVGGESERAAAQLARRAVSLRRHDAAAALTAPASVVRTFRDKFALQLPRETREQAEIGTRIDKRDLLPGDLVFFKTGSGRAVCTLASTIPTTSLFTPPPARASPVPRWITSTGTKKFWQARRI